MEINLEPIINKNLQYSNVINKLIKTSSPHQIYPTITISRDSGSGGRDIAQEVAKKLKVQCIDQQLIDMISQQAKIKRKLVEALDEKTQSAIESIVNSFLGFESLPENTFIKNLATVVLSIAGNQPSVILGRGVNFILPPITTLRVRITAPRRVLIKYAMKYEGHTPAKAREIIDHHMKERHDFVFKYFGKDIRKAHYYDLVINTEFLTIQDASEIIISAFKRKFSL